MTKNEQILVFFAGALILISFIFGYSMGFNNGKEKFECFKFENEVSKFDTISETLGVENESL